LANGWAEERAAGANRNERGERNSWRWSMIDEPLFCTYKSILDFYVQIVNSRSPTADHGERQRCSSDFQGLDQRCAAC
jgi:hypothetical protein